MEEINNPGPGTYEALGNVAEGNQLVYRSM